MPSHDRPGDVELQLAGCYVAASRPQARLILVGATHVAAKLAQLARIVDLAPIIVDPRAQLAVPERFPGAEIRCEQPGRALAGLLDARSSVVVLTHDAKLDDPALEVALVEPLQSKTGTNLPQIRRLADVR